MHSFFNWNWSGSVLILTSFNSLCQYVYYVYYQALMKSQLYFPLMNILKSWQSNSSKISVWVWISSLFFLYNMCDARKYLKNFRSMRSVGWRSILALVLEVIEVLEVVLKVWSSVRSYFQKYFINSRRVYHKVNAQNVEESSKSQKLLTQSFPDEASKGFHPDSHWLVFCTTGK